MLNGKTCHGNGGTDLILPTEGSPKLAGQPPRAKGKVMGDLVYIDETGDVGKGANKQPYLQLVGAVVDESRVQSLASRMLEIAREHLGEIPDDFEWHGVEVWHGQGSWKGQGPAKLLSAYEAVIALLDELDIWICYSTIHKKRLRDRYSEKYSPYLLAFQFLLEKLDGRYPEKVDRFEDFRDGVCYPRRLVVHKSEEKKKLRILIADETKQHQLRTITMVADMQKWGIGAVRSKYRRDIPLASVIDSVHFVDSQHSPGVQLADMVAFILHRERLGDQNHPDANAAVYRMTGMISSMTGGYRKIWPPEPTTPPIL